MPHCISFRSPSSSSQATDNVNPHPPQSQENSTDGTPRSGSQILSPTVNLSQEYIQAVQSSSYNEMWSKIHLLDPNANNGEEVGRVELSLEQVLQPDRQRVEEALSLARVNTLTRLVKSYFDHSERSSSLCIALYHCIHRARDMYAPLYKLLDVLPLNGHISESQCDRALDIFLEFGLQTNPFPCPQNNFTEMGRCFLQLKHQLARKLAKSRSRVHLIRNAKTGSAICLIGTVMGVAVSAAVVAAHALGLLAAAPLCAARCQCPDTPTFTKREVAHVAQLDAAARGTFVLLGELDTIDRLVVMLYDAIEDDRKKVRFALERGTGRERRPVEEVVRMLCKNRVKIAEQTRDLEERVCLCFATVNRARDLLLQEVITHQSFR